MTMVKYIGFLRERGQLGKSFTICRREALLENCVSYVV